MANSMEPAGRKSSMMERLRRLRTSGPSASLQSTTPQTGKVVVAARRTADAAMANNLTSKPRSRHRDEGLDLQKVNSKLELYQQKQSQNESQDEEAKADQTTDEKDGSSDGEVKEPTAATKQSTKGEIGTGMRKVMGDSKLGVKKDNKTNPESASQRSMASTCPSIVITPPDDETTGTTEPTDFQVFLQQAEVDEHKRKANGQPAISKAKQEPSLNPFYSNNLASPSSTNPPKLAEIQETIEGDENGVAAQGELLTTELPAASPSLGSSATSASSGSNDFAAAETIPTRLNTASLGRHVSFSEPEKLRERRESHSSAYHGRGYESPEALRTVKKRKSFRRILRKCIRPL